MEEALLEYLRCPFCGSALEIEKVIHINTTRIIDGILRCMCREYPLISGILYMRDDEISKKVLMLLRKERLHAALYLILEGRMIKKAIIWANRFHIQPTFWRIIGLWNWKYWTYYLRYRFSAPSFIAAVALLPVIKEACDGYMLDLCAGVGHFSFAAAKHIPPTQIICVERRFTSLYFAREFFIPHAAAYIAWEAHQMLPFVDNFFKTIVCLDSFHYLDTKYLVSKEIERVLTYEGVVLLPHLHNQKMFNILPGSPLTVHDYQRLFSNFRFRMIPEETILKNLLEAQVLDITHNDNVDEVDAFTMIMSKTDRYFKQYSTHMLFSDAEELIVNPIYRQRKTKKGWQLKLKFPCRLYKVEFPLINKYFEKRLFISNEDINNTDTIYKLQTQFVLINVPPRFVQVKHVIKKR
jgi:ubiquinone/menaquinone biosynthesis C-methylase UbiE/uncharacterized protein YbaR (Trm112 family)